MNEHIDYDTRLRNLGSQVNQFSSKSSDNVISSSSILEKIRTTRIYYILVPVAIFIVLFVLKPSFIMDEVKVDSVLTKKVMNYNKLLMVDSVLTLAILMTYFIYNHKMTKHPL